MLPLSACWDWVGLRGDGEGGVRHSRETLARLGRRDRGSRRSRNDLGIAFREGQGELLEAGIDCLGREGFASPTLLRVVLVGDLLKGEALGAEFDDVRAHGDGLKATDATTLAGGFDSVAHSIGLTRFHHCVGRSDMFVCRLLSATHSLCHKVDILSSPTLNFFSKENSFL